MAKEHKCVDCGKIITHKNPRCFSCINRKRWEEPGRKERQRELMSDILRENNRKLWSEEEYLEQQPVWRERANEIRWAKPDAKETYSSFINDYWSDEDNRIAQSERMIAYRESIGYVESDYPSEFNDRLREKIRNYDKRCCVLCMKTEEEDGQRMSVHHIDGDKENSSLCNLVSVCRVCHGHIHNRQSWFWPKVLIGALSYRMKG